LVELFFEQISVYDLVDNVNLVGKKVVKPENFLTFCRTAIPAANFCEEVKFLSKVFCVAKHRTCILLDLFMV